MENRKKFVKEKFMDLLRSSGASITKIAKLSGVPFGTLTHWYYGEAVPSIDNAVAVLSALGYEVTVTKKEEQHDL